ncbi:Sulfate transporter 3.1 [Zostera marina]|uniref:Sulfate transporter 3.1 n=1 Tax=Zostera marina TaxID=29655 RepID=A0A0K9P3X8_ZOSMR|nr:Sulfate transporter 3.1 [Zostera marina]
MLKWLPKYTLTKFQDDLVAGITIASVTIPQSICHARLTHLPPIIGLYSCFVPPLIYSIFGSSKNVAIGTVASASILSASIIGDEVSPIENPDLYLCLVFTSTFFAGIFQTMIGIFRLGILVDFLSKPTILGFMSGTATIIILQQCKGILGLTHFTIEADAVYVVHSLYHHLQEFLTMHVQSSWETLLIGLVFVCFLLLAKYIKHKKPKLFWLSAMAAPLVMIFGGLFLYLIHAEDHGIPTVGPLKKGLNPLSIGHLTFNNQHLRTVIKAGIVTGSLDLAEGIAVGRSLALMNNDHVDGNKEMIAFGMMNIVGSFTSCYLTTAPFSKSAVNYDYGCKTAMSNVVMATCIMLVFLFLGPFFRYTPLVSLASMILLSTGSLIKLKEIKELFKIDKFDFCICIISFLGVVFLSMDIGLLISVSISVIKILLNAARPKTYKLGNFENTTMYQDVEQYPSSSTFSGILVLRICAPLFFANAGYLREKIKRWVESELDLVTSSGCQNLEYIILDVGGSRF